MVPRFDFSIVEGHYLPVDEEEIVIPHDAIKRRLVEFFDVIIQDQFP